MRHLKLAAAGVGLALPFLGAGLLVVGRVDPFQLLDRLLSTATPSGPAGMALLLAVQTLVAASGILPASLVGIAAGMVWGSLAGFGVAAACTFAGALATFLVTRRASEATLGRLFRTKPRLKAFDALLRRDGWRFVCLLRLSPVMPFAATSYLLGLSTIGLADYVIGTCASLPALAGYVLAGAFLKHVGTTWQAGIHRLPLLLLGLGLAATLLLTIRIGQLAARAVATAQADGLAPEGC